MNILVACDSFKDALSADAVCHAIATGLARSHPDAEIAEMPLSDGGEGLLDVLAPSLQLAFIESMVADPLGRRIKGRYGLSPDGVAVVEMADASGLQRLSLAERDPRKTSTFGTGQQLADAKARGARRAILAIGGSAPNGAAWIYGRQKGGSDAVLAELDDGLRHIADVVKAQLGKDAAEVPGAGAA